MWNENHDDDTNHHHQRVMTTRWWLSCHFRQRQHQPTSHDDSLVVFLTISDNDNTNHHHQRVTFLAIFNGDHTNHHHQRVMTTRWWCFNVSTHVFRVTEELQVYNEARDAYMSRAPGMYLFFPSLFFLLTFICFRLYTTYGVETAITGQPPPPAPYTLHTTTAHYTCPNNVSHVVGALCEFFF